MNIIEILEKEQMKKDFKADFKPGDTVKIQIKVVEGGKERYQNFEGVCIKRQNTGLNESFTLRKITNGVGVERTMLVHSPMLHSCEVTRYGDVRKSRLYYLRDKVGKKARVKERKMVFVKKNKTEAAV